MKDAFPPNHESDFPSPQPNNPHKKGGFQSWVVAVAGELCPGGAQRSLEPYEEALEVLLDEHGSLAPDHEGYPIAYDASEPMSQGARLISVLYREAFAPREEAEKQAGRDRTYLRVYSSLYDPDKGVGDCVGILESREPYSNARGDGAPPHLPDKLLFHDNYIYLRGFSCSSEKGLFDVYNNILTQQVSNPTLHLAEGLSKDSLEIARLANLADSSRQLGVTLLGLASDAVAEYLTRAEQSMYYAVLDALQDAEDS